MLHLKSFCFGPFQENTYLLYDDQGECFIFDPGNSTSSENSEMKTFIEEKKLKPSRLLLTHAHLDHVLGNKFVHDTWGLLPEVNEYDLFFIEKMMQSSSMYGIPAEQSPMPSHFLKEGEKIKLAEHELLCIHTPGHSPGSISFYYEKSKFLISGDVLFLGSIGRTDLPMGNHETLLNSIRKKLFVLPGEVKVYSGHGPSTNIGFERENNPFF